MKKTLLMLALFSAIAGCKKDTINGDQLSTKWQLISSTAFAYSPTQYLGPVRVVYPVGDYLSISQDSIWLVSAHTPNIGYTMDPTTNILSNFSSNQSLSISSSITTFHKINDTLYSANFDTIHIRTLSSTSLVLYNNAHDSNLKTGMIEIDSLKIF